MPDIVISDTSCLILLDKIKELDLLKKVYKNIVTTPEVAREFVEELPEWIKLESVKDRKYQEFIQTQVDLGEASAMALAKEKDNPLLLLDDLKARKLASKLNLRFTGTLGLINKAKQVGVISKIKPLLDKLVSSDFRISEKIIDELLKINGEIPTSNKR